MAKYLDSAGVTYLWKKIKANFAPIGHTHSQYLTSVTLASGTKNGTLKLTVNGTATDNIAVTGLGTAAYTASTAYAEASHKTQIAKTATLGHIKANHLFSGINVTLGSDTEKLPTSITLADVTTTANRFYPVYTDKSGVAFVNIPWTMYTHPNSGVTAGTYRSVTVNAQGHVTAGTNPTTLAGYGITNAYTKTETDNLLGGYLKLNGGGTITGVSGGTISITGDDLSIGGTLSFQAAATVLGLGSYSSGTRGNDNLLASTKYVIDAIEGKFAGQLAVADALIFKGVINAPTGTTGLSGKKDYKIGWTYKVGTAGTYAGKVCEVGDMIIAIADYNTSFKDTDWTVVQNNVDIASEKVPGFGKVGSVLGESAGTVDNLDSYVNIATDYKYLKIAVDSNNCFCAAYPLAMSDVDIDHAILEVGDGGGSEVS